MESAVATLSHYPREEGDGGVASDVSVVEDVTRIDAFDVGPPTCNGIRFAREVTIPYPPTGGITPRLVRLSGGEIGVVSVDQNGAPSSVLYERLPEDLSRTEGTEQIHNRNWSWAEPAFLRGELHIATAMASNGAGQRTELRSFRPDGRPGSTRAEIPIMHPVRLKTLGDDLLWMGFDTSGVNQLELVYVSAGGEMLHPPHQIEMGRYGSGSALLPRDAESHVVTYTREASPGVRDGFVRFVDKGGVLGPERRLSNDGDITVVPVEVGGELFLVRHNDEGLFVERTDFESLERIDRQRFAPATNRPFAVNVGDRLVVGDVEGRSLRLRDFGADLSAPISLTHPILSSAVRDVLPLGNAVVVVDSVGMGGERRLWLARFECVTG